MDYIETATKIKPTKLQLCHRTWQ